MIRDMKDRGMSNREIARDLGVSRNTVSKLLRTTRLADHRKRERGSKLDPYREKIRALIDEHNLSAVRILEEIRKMGYDGGYTILMCSLYHLDSYKREYIEIRRYNGESRGGFANLLHHPHGTGDAHASKIHGRAEGTDCH